MLSHSENFHISISKADLSQLPTVHYTGGAVIIDSLEKVTAAIESLREAPIIGFDTETRPSFRKGVSHKASLVQLATPSECFLFRIKKIGLPQALSDLLTDENVLKVGLSINDDFHQLAKLGLHEPKGFVDLQKFVKKFMIADNSLSRIYGILFGQRISKGQQLSNWEAPDLTEAQINYAAFDAIACINIYQYLKEGKFNPESSRYICRVEINNPS